MCQSLVGGTGSFRSPAAVGPDAVVVRLPGQRAHAPRCRAGIADEQHPGSIGERALAGETAHRVPAGGLVAVSSVETNSGGLPSRARSNRVGPPSASPSAAAGNSISPRTATSSPATARSVFPRVHGFAGLLAVQIGGGQSRPVRAVPRDPAALPGGAICGRCRRGRRRCRDSHRSHRRECPCGQGPRAPAAGACRRSGSAAESGHRPRTSLRRRALARRAVE